MLIRGTDEMTHTCIFKETLRYADCQNCKSYDIAHCENYLSIYTVVRASNPVMDRTGLIDKDSNPSFLSLTPNDNHSPQTKPSNWGKSSLERLSAERDEQPKDKPVDNNHRHYIPLLVQANERQIERNHSILSWIRRVGRDER